MEWNGSMNSYDSVSHIWWNEPGWLPIYLWIIYPAVVVEVEE